MPVNKKRRSKDSAVQMDDHTDVLCLDLLADEYYEFHEDIEISERERNLCDEARVSAINNLLDTLERNHTCITADSLKIRGHDVHPLALILACGPCVTLRMIQRFENGVGSSTFQKLLATKSYHGRFIESKYPLLIACEVGSGDVIEYIATKTPKNLFGR